MNKIKIKGKFIFERRVFISEICRFVGFCLYSCSSRKLLFYWFEVFDSLGQVVQNVRGMEGFVKGESFKYIYINFV